ncbi:MAG: FGGY family carbohydrate kinase [Planctomycetota bacterium]
MGIDSKHALGLNSSTQSITAVVVDLQAGAVVYRKSLDYAADARLNHFGIDASEYIIPPKEPGEADQPPLMYLASIDALFHDMKSDGVDLSAIAVINSSAQQHGHLYLNAESAGLFARLKEPGSHEKNLVSLLKDGFSHSTAPIWKTSSTATQAAEIRAGVGGSEKMIRLSGSDSPLRFTGAILRRMGRRFPNSYKDTETIQLISSFVPAVLTGHHRTPMDYGNGCGTSLMDYQRKTWSRELAGATGAGLPGGGEGLLHKLPHLISPDSLVGAVALYFIDKYGFDRHCRVAAGSGDNPQTKVLIKDDLLSLGTSFVNMVSTDGKTYDMDGYANAMYDGLGRPFMFGCRTNGAMVWDRVRRMHGLGKNGFAPADSALADSRAGRHIFIWQPDSESFPVSGQMKPTRIGYEKPNLKEDYCSIVDSSLGLVYLYSRGFTKQSHGPIAVTGGVSKNKEVLKRVAGIWNRPAYAIGTAGAALGAALSGAVALAQSEGFPLDPESLSASALPRGGWVEPRPEDVKAYHGAGNFLDRLKFEFEKLR